MSEHDQHGPWKYIGTSAIIRCEKCFQTAVEIANEQSVTIATLRAEVERKSDLYDVADREQPTSEETVQRIAEACADVAIVSGNKLTLELHDQMRVLFAAAIRDVTKEPK